MQEVELRTGVWYSDKVIKLTFPDAWDVVTYWPDTPPPLTNIEIQERINSPVGQLPLRELAKGKKRPVIIIDDLARPTPVFKIMPLLLEEFHLAHIPPSHIRILVATGTHGNQDKQALTNKIGKEASKSCHVIIHNDRRDTRYIGKTSFKTPVYVNSELLDSDLIIGIGGVYPQHTTGFGGGSKLVLGVLGRKSITHLHFTHSGVGGTYNIDNDFRKDLTEIARMINLNTIYTLHINAQLELVNLICGDHFTYYPDAAKFSKIKYTAPLPNDADAVIVNAYPSDLSYTFMRKGIKPIRCASRDATKVMVASNYEGIGTHGLFQQGEHPLIEKYKALFHEISIMESKVIVSKVIKKLFSIIKNPFLGKRQLTHRNRKGSELAEKKEYFWLYRPEGAVTPIPPVTGMRIERTWDEILRVIEREHISQKKIKVRVYPCASLQCLDALPTQEG
jgi:nickel-dependent lactate racemase